MTDSSVNRMTKLTQEKAVQQRTVVPTDPIDYILQPSTRSEMVARWISDLFCPPVLAAVSLLVVAIFAESIVVWESTGVFLVLAIGLPTCYVFWLVKKKVVTDFHIPVRRQRIKPMLFMLASGSVSMVLLWILRPPRLVVLLSVAAFWQLAIIFLITLKWKISGHAAAASTFSTLCWLLFGPIAGFVFILVPVVIWARIRLKRHTPMQTLAGTILGMLSLFGLLLVM